MFEILPASGFHAGKHTFQFARTGYAPEALGIKTVQTDIDAIHASLPKGLRIFVQLRAIGGQQQLLEARKTTETLYQRHHIVAHQRLAPCQANLVHPQFGKGLRNDMEFFQ